MVADGSGVRHRALAVFQSGDTISPPTETIRVPNSGKAEMIRLSAFADEISPDPTVQLDCLAENEIHHIEFRSVFGTNLLDLTDKQHHEFRNLLKDRGFSLSALGSPIGKIAITDPFEPHLEKFENSLDLAQFYGVGLIRVFSYYLPPGEPPAKYRDKVIRRMATKAEIAGKAGVTLVLENERGIYGDTAARVLDILETVNQPSLGHAFDPANYLEVGQPIDQAWSMLRDRTIHFHVKDYSESTKKNVPAGEGDGKIAELIADAVGRGYEGFCTLEPHLILAEKSHGFTGPERFGDAARALKKGLTERGVGYL